MRYRKLRSLFRRRDHAAVAFVLASPRSGTTWLQKMLGAHPSIACVEGRLFGGFAESWPEPGGGSGVRITLDAYARLVAGYLPFSVVETAPNDFEDSFIRRYIAMLHGWIRDATGKPVIVDKVTPYLGTAQKVVASINRYFPDAKLIYLVRDGRDVAVSGAFHWLQRDGVGTERYRWFVEKDKKRFPERFFDDRELGRWCAYWRETEEALRGCEVLVVRYEELHADVVAALGRICAYLGVSSDVRVLRQCVASSTFEVLSGGRARGQEDPLAAARRGVVGDWKRWFTRRDGEVFLELTGNLLVDLGYEHDQRWIERLPSSLVESFD